MVEETIKNESKISEILFDLSQIQEEMKHNLSNNYFNNHAVISSTIRKPLLNLVFTLQDILLIGALTCSSVLLSGSSGSGKTLLAELVSTFLFGKEGYTRKNITPDMNEQDFMDIDFGAIKEGKKLKEALLADQLFTRPVIIIDEANRAPPIVQNRLLQILENNIDLKSKKIKAGIKLENGEFYQWDILTLNLGQEYAGTSTVDRALRDRITIDIPIDNFPPTLDDQIKMIRKSSIIKGISSDNYRQSVIFKIFQSLDDISLSLEAEALLLYLSFTSNCIKSPTKSKFGINFSPTYCKMKDCPYARNPPLNEICPFTYAPSNRVLRKVIQVAKGFNVLRHTKIISNLQLRENKDELISYLQSNQKLIVTIDDVLAIAPLILHSKVSMNREWVLNKFNGNSFLAVKHLLKIINSRLNDFMDKILPYLVKKKRGDTLSEKESGKIKRLTKEDFHFEGLIKYVDLYLA